MRNRGWVGRVKGRQRLGYRVVHLVGVRLVYGDDKGEDWAGLMGSKGWVWSGLIGDYMGLGMF